ncbi:hypothetical protein [Paracoccus sp. (in: a-proteobacteria)]|uniref:hypothetical protein n=1 Tax=Paracoccus sp. TaxID=267 RepID=UPI0026E09254|nr:hypothetical protein [Paracoccus sp. (in: a-proteobacteria)]MDO5370480.1 hypothetical protein [Paracoccus sp. (in: a-proteobacteria)]
MRFPRIALAAAIAAIPVSAAQSAILPSPALNAPVKGWTAVAGLSGPEVVELARTLPLETEASGNMPWCDAAPVVSAALKSEFEENLIARRADGTQLWGSGLMGTWTVLLERADDTNCVIASGIGYQDGVDPGAFYAKVGLG